MITRLSSPAAASFSADKHKSGSGFIYPNRFVNANTKHQLKTTQKIKHNLAYMDYAMIFVYSFIGD